MKIRMITLAAGPVGVFSPGKVYTVEDAFGAPLVEGGYATRLDTPVPVVAKTAKPVKRSSRTLSKHRSRRGS